MTCYALRNVVVLDTDCIDFLSQYYFIACSVVVLQLRDVPSRLSHHAAPMQAKVIEDASKEIPATFQRPTQRPTDNAA